MLQVRAERVEDDIPLNPFTAGEPTSPVHPPHLPPTLSRHAVVAFCSQLQALCCNLHLLACFVLLCVHCMRG